ncbi:hypothetical protein FOL47_010072 [Perkinsus chesapeaki]|uniref:Uncharacterized protein n=1 Tax=Perkinsus chesapeaki TaxID=330153 RepID=A0A7J6MQE9_PERCH|nr:hypothetical protein FOL47_010072 [Perkinsus chesapeaki]
MPPHRNIKPPPAPHLLAFTEEPLKWSQLPLLDETSVVCHHGCPVDSDEAAHPTNVVLEEEARRILLEARLMTSRIGVVAASTNENLATTKGRISSLARVFGYPLNTVEALIVIGDCKPSPEEAIKLWERKLGPIGDHMPKKKAPPSSSSPPVMLMLCGLPGSGKSTMSKRYLLPAGYTRVCQDVLKSKNKTLKEVERLLQEGRDIVDRTNADRSQRQGFIDIAKQYGAKVWVCVLDTERETCRARLKSREVHEGKSVTASQKNALLIGHGIMTRRWEAPRVDEGIDEIRKASTVEEVDMLGEHYGKARSSSDECDADTPKAKRLKFVQNYPIDC